MGDWGCGRRWLVVGGLHVDEFYGSGVQNGSELESIWLGESSELVEDWVSLSRSTLPSLYNRREYKKN